ncbi:hypothetical protein F2Q69_00048256 [Brassica cretica]|uniref:Uncharacterized protein n=1 Tax=Brassica cretica TaxID=69181 RepID=A0A8S9PWW4_BRACR|nr:hypothetical protein F2Q69_00048256 [Brassica cretica]
MTGNTQDDQPDHDDNIKVDNIDNTTPVAYAPAANGMHTPQQSIKNLVSTLVQKSNDQDKLTSSLSKHVETLTMRTRDFFPCRAMRIRSGRRLNFKNSQDGPANTYKNPSGQNPDCRT